MEITLRPEEEADYRSVEELTREAFWNINFPGCVEHFVIHNLRKAKEFVAALDFVAVGENKIIGNIVYAHAQIKNPAGAQTILTFGPVSVLPEYQERGIGSRLINHTIKLSAEMGYKAIVIYGDPAYYKRFGFIESKKYGITNKDGKYPAALLVLELYPDALNGIAGIFDEGSAYGVDEKAFEEFESHFAPKEKAVTESQKKFVEIAGRFL